VYLASVATSIVGSEVHQWQINFDPRTFTHDTVPDEGPDSIRQVKEVNDKSGETKKATFL